MKPYSKDEKALFIVCMIALAIPLVVGIVTILMNDQKDAASTAAPVRVVIPNSL